MKKHEKNFSYYLIGPKHFKNKSLSSKVKKTLLLKFLGHLSKKNSTVWLTKLLRIKL